MSDVFVFNLIVCSVVTAETPVSVNVAVAALLTISLSELIGGIIGRHAVL